MFRLLSTLTRTIAWMQIAASPLLVGLLVGTAIYLYAPGNLTFALGLSATLLGLAAGVYWAKKAEKQRGVVEFMAALSSTPELTKPIEDQGEEKNHNGEKDIKAY